MRGRAAIRTWHLELAVAPLVAGTASPHRSEPTMTRWWIHNLVAHPLLVLCPPLGRWLHERTI